MIDFGRLAYEVFNVLKTFDYDVLMFDAGGTSVIEPKQARRFFSKGEDVAVDIIEDAENSVLKFIKAESVPMQDVLSFSRALRKLANRIYMMTFTIEGHDGPIAPKHFSRPLGESQHTKLEESMYGTSRSSYLKFPKSKLIVKHRGKVDENSTGARSRRIDRMFVENAAGERFLLETKYLSAGKAMAQHVSHGGSVSDDIGNKLCEKAADYLNLAKAKAHIRKNADVLEEAAIGLREDIHACRKSIRHVFERIYRNYEAASVDLEAGEEVLLEGDELLEAKNRVTNCISCEGAELEEEIIEAVARYNLVKETPMSNIENEGVTSEDDLKNPVLKEHIDWINGFTVENIFLSESEDEDEDEDCCEDDENELSREDILMPKSQSADLEREVVKDKGPKESGPQMLLDDEEDCSEARRIAEQAGITVCPAESKFVGDEDAVRGRYAVCLPGDDFLAEIFDDEAAAWKAGRDFTKVELSEDDSE